MFPCLFIEIFVTVRVTNAVEMVDQMVDQNLNAIRRVINLLSRYKGHVSWLLTIRYRQRWVGFIVVKWLKMEVVL